LSTTTKPAILVVEDETAIQELLCYTLRQAGFEPIPADNAEAALQQIHAQLPAAALLDVMLPGMSGIELAQRLRKDSRTKALPIIMVTARGDEADRVRGLDIGADDYVTKPFSPKELIARIRAVLRRRAPHQAGDVVEIRGLRLDPVAHSVSLHGKILALGPTEFQMLQFLMNSPNRVFSRDQLLNALRGDHAVLEDRTIDVYVRRLRAALGTEHEAMIETVRGVGYKITNLA
jgi:two-component system phosphate regulon response regulator PhoB